MAQSIPYYFLGVLRFTMKCLCLYRLLPDKLSKAFLGDFDLKQQKTNPVNSLSSDSKALRYFLFNYELVLKQD